MAALVAATALRNHVMSIFQLFISSWLVSFGMNNMRINDASEVYGCPAPELVRACLSCLLAQNKARRSHSTNTARISIRILSWQRHGLPFAPDETRATCRLSTSSAFRGLDALASPG
ncbi:hypothetical protein BJY01DRAFT_43178 [Aspergillus pseudoustus]|uniref:Secreted protein n=1 Tax=Aspergillus pseudoustus TaxID=1810923 RepID=A0ABR4KPM2_9EURO